MAEVTWFKVLTDIFSDDKIKILQSMPEGDSLLVMWFKVLAQAGKTNDGGYIYLKKNIPYTNGMLATLFGKQQQLVELAMRTFSEFGMVDVDDRGYVFVTNWEKHQSIDALEKIKEQDRIRAANYRERKRLELNDNHVTVTLPSQANHATELELELDKEKEKSTTDDFEKVRIAYREIHHVLDMPYGDSSTLTNLLKDGIPPSLIIGVMRDKFKHGVKTIKYYVEAIRERFNQTKPKQMPMDPQIAQRHREIAFNRFIDGGGNPNEFIYNAPTSA
jgi:predicted phage replisome organizer